MSAYGEEEHEMFIGIDAGTSNFVVAKVEDNKPKVLQMSAGKNVLPALIAGEVGGLLIGENAKGKPIFVCEAKRLIGCQFDDAFIQENLKYWSSGIIKDEDGKPRFIVKINDKEFHWLPEMVMASIFEYMIKQIYQGMTLGKAIKIRFIAVVTVPAHFGFNERQSIILAARLAGIEVKLVITEPAAAAVATGLQRNRRLECDKFLVIDIGGGTFDVAYLKVKDRTFQVIDYSRDSHLGGQDFVNMLYDKFQPDYETENTVKLSSSPDHSARLRSRCIRAMHELTDLEVVAVKMSAEEEGEEVENITRSEFNKICQNLANRIENNITGLLEKNGIVAPEFDHVILVGGASRIPLVKETVERLFKLANKHPCLNPDTIVAEGAALIAHSFTEHGDDYVLKEVSPISLGTSVFDFEDQVSKYVELIPQGTEYPCIRKYCGEVSEENKKHGAVSIRIWEGKHSFESQTMLDGFSVPLPPDIEVGTDFEIELSLDANCMIRAKGIEHKNMTSKTIVFCKSYRQEYFEEIEKEREDYKIFEKELSELELGRETVMNRFKVLKESVSDITAQNEIDTLFAKIKPTLKQKNKSNAQKYRDLLVEANTGLDQLEEKFEQGNSSWNEAKNATIKSQDFTSTDPNSSVDSVRSVELGHAKEGERSCDSLATSISLESCSTSTIKSDQFFVKGTLSVPNEGRFEDETILKSDIESTILANDGILQSQQDENLDPGAKEAESEFITGILSSGSPKSNQNDQFKNEQIEGEAIQQCNSHVDISLNDNIFWRFVIRIYLSYMWFQIVILKMEGSVDSGKVHLPGVRFYLKYGNRVTLEEAHLTKYAAALLSGKVKVPRIYCAIKRGESVYILMDKVKGDTLRAMWSSLDSRKQNGVICQLRAAVQCLRTNRQVSISGLHGRSLYHPVLPNKRLGKTEEEKKKIGPFLSIEAFHQFLIMAHWPSRKYQQNLNEGRGFDITFERSDWTENEAVFSHGDLSPHNIMIDKDGQVSIIDWETAGWWPTYIEYFMAYRYELRGWRYLGIPLKDWLSYEEREIYMINGFFDYHRKLV